MRRKVVLWWKEEAERWKRISTGKKVGMLVTLFCLCLAVFHGVTHAQGLFPDKQDLESTYYFLKYPMDNYSLDYSFEGDKGVFGALEGLAGVFYGLASILWSFCVGVCKIGIYLMDMSLRFDMVENSLGVVSRSLGNLFGIHGHGISGGVFGNLFRFAVLALGVYVAFIGIVERKYTEVWKSVGMFILVLVISISFANHSKEYLSAVNDGVNELTQAISSIGMGVFESKEKKEEIHDSGGSVANKVGEKKVQLATSSMCEMLFDIQVRKPWLCLQFGTADKKEIEERYGEGTIKEIESRAFGSEKRDEKVKKVIEADEEADRMAYMTENGSNSRIGGIFFIFIANLVITGTVGFFCILMILGQVMFLVCVFLLPFAFFLALIPGKERILKKSLLRTVLYLFVKVGLVVLLTVLFSVVGLIYQVSLENNIPVIVMQILIACVFLYVLKNIDQLLKLFGISEGVRDLKGIRQSLKKPEEKAKRIVAGGAGMLGGYSLGKLGYLKDGLTKEGRENHRREKKEKIASKAREKLQNERQEARNDRFVKKYGDEDKEYFKKKDLARYEKLDKKRKDQEDKKAEKRRTVHFKVEEKSGESVEGSKGETERFRDYWNDVANRSETINTYDQTPDSYRQETRGSSGESYTREGNRKPRFMDRFREDYLSGDFTLERKDLVDQPVVKRSKWHNFLRGKDND